MIDSSLPLVSCICITYKRPDMLLKAIFDFLRQSYLNKELIISYTPDDLATQEIILQISLISDGQIIALERKMSDSLGEARNQAVAMSNGEYICTWDDDDRYHSERIMMQFSAMHAQSLQAAIISCVFLFDTMTQGAYQSGPQQCGGTLICKKDLILQYPFTDTNVAEETHLITSLASQGALHKIKDAAHLYTFIYHQHNILDYLYFQSFLYTGYLLTAEIRDFILDEYERRYAIL